MTGTRILVMAKAPVPGAVKTRLRLEPARAARLQGALISDTVERARDVAPVTVAASPRESLHLVRRLIGPETPLVAQPEGDLGQRMLAGARGLFARGEGPVLVLGTDAPTLPPRYVVEAVRSLAGKDAHDAALTPSEDGGYVLIGLRKPHAALFEDISWSTLSVHEQTVTAAGRAGISLHETPPWYDVDDPDDLNRLRAELLRNPGLAPRTARLLAREDARC